MASDYYGRLEQGVVGIPGGKRCRVRRAVGL